MKTLLLLASVAALLFANALAGDITLAWDANSEPDLAGYRIHYGDASGVYTQTIDVGNVTQFTLKNLPNGETFFSALTAYNTGDLESGFSNEISFLVEPTKPAPPQNFRKIVLEVSDNGKEWQPVASVNYDEGRFYRLTTKPVE